MSLTITSTPPTTQWVDWNALCRAIRSEIDRSQLPHGTVSQNGMEIAAFTYDNVNHNIGITMIGSQTEIVIPHY